MKKKVFSLALALVFVAGTAASGMAARYVKCEVKEIKGEMVTLECDDAVGLAVGSKVQVKGEKKRKGIEGC
jgi:ABC-type transporter Mla subunit MlaD